MKSTKDDFLVKQSFFLSESRTMFVISCVRKQNQGIGTLTMTGAGFVVWLGFANEDQEGYCPRRLRARSWLRRPMRDRQVLV